ncbi:uncharacterized protein LOC124280509 [Haliotis rubra]|uniref:uncharacterized protein LOC124280509 n=1 Tax=Haliotis rubra TaxID=36100 RepID=UPI001EE526D5|nr:uncharacterized protein LOC124280509 [Haliotis rubra]
METSSDTPMCHLCLVTGHTKTHKKENSSQTGSKLKWGNPDFAFKFTSDVLLPPSNCITLGAHSQYAHFSPGQHDLPTMTSPITLMLVLFLTSVQGNVLLKDAIRNAFYGLSRDFASGGSKQLTEAGHVQSCSPTDPKFNVTWEPKVLDPEGSIVVNYTYKIPHDFNSGIADVALYFNKIQNPIFEDSFPVTCDEVKKYIPCPFKGGPTFHGTYPYSNLLILKGYDGIYKAKVNLKNQDGQVMFCAIAVVEIKGKDQDTRNPLLL